MSFHTRYIAAWSCQLYVANHSHFLPAQRLSNAHVVLIRVVGWQFLCCRLTAALSQCSLTGCAIAELKLRDRACVSLDNENSFQICLKAFLLKDYIFILIDLLVWIKHKGKF